MNIPTKAQTFKLSSNRSITYQTKTHSPYDLFYFIRTEICTYELKLTKPTPITVNQTVFNPNSANLRSFELNSANLQTFESNSNQNGLACFELGLTTSSSRVRYKIAPKTQKQYTWLNCLLSHCDHN